uniref:Uncharacterized protein n=1 Tax=Arundo donax TaxID=35708 RepID=A0A0A8YPF0_ARUDO
MSVVDLLTHNHITGSRNKKKYSFIIQFSCSTSWLQACNY